MNPECIFCKIIKGEIPSHKVYEDTDVFAFLDITPINPGHTLIIPKSHTENIYTISESDFEKVTKIVKKIAIGIRKGLESDGVNVRMNNEKAAGQDIFHAHIHVIPRYKNDGYEPWHGKKGVSPQDLRKAAGKIIDSI